MDYTLAEYNSPTFEQMCFDIIKEKLIKQKGYPEEIAKLKYNPDYPIRGLVFDKQYGLNSLPILFLQKEKFTFFSCKQTKRKLPENW